MRFSRIQGSVLLFLIISCFSSASYALPLYLQPGFGVSKPKSNDSSPLGLLDLKFGMQKEYVQLSFLSARYFLSEKFANELGSGLYTVGAGVGWEWNIPLITHIYADMAGGYMDKEEVIKDLDVKGYHVGIGYFLTPEHLINFEYTQLEVTYNLTTDAPGAADRIAELKAFSVYYTYLFDFDYPDLWWRK